jgi:hypothetical protein
MGADELECEESVLFQAVLRYIAHRRDGANTLVSLVRFPLMSVKDLGTLVAPSKLVSDADLLQLFLLASTEGAVGSTAFSRKPRVPREREIVIECWGAGGAGGKTGSFLDLSVHHLIIAFSDPSAGGAGGAGGYIQVKYCAQSKERLDITVGRCGVLSATSASSDRSGGGHPNGGHGYGICFVLVALSRSGDRSGSSAPGGGGGGSSHVTSSFLNNSVVVGAGGGGGGGGGHDSTGIGGGGGGGTCDGRVGRGGAGLFGGSSNIDACGD